MDMTSINPATGSTIKSFAVWHEDQIDACMAKVAAAGPAWRALDFAARGKYLLATARVLREQAPRYAALMTAEMGKPAREARAEVEKCAWVCEFYAGNAAGFLADEVIVSDAGRSYVAYQPLGTVLAVMPWNFPFWQVFRFAAPSLMAGNTAVLKHASNVPQCALAIEEIFRTAGLPPDVFRSVLISGPQAERLIADPRIHAVTLTGSETAGRKVAAAAGANLKKAVLELGGSDAFIVLSDADLELAAATGVASRYLNNGQSCIAAKRFIVVDSVADRFLALFKEKVQALKIGDPARDDTQLGPMAREDLRDELHRQVTDSITQGASAVLGCKPRAGVGCYYEPSILDQVRPGILAYSEELFGPVAIFIRASDDEDALRVANDHRYGLGGGIWTRDAVKGEAYARRLESGCAFVNGLVKSDPRLPFGGIKSSGFGRELSRHGIREFVNAKTVWIR